MRANHYLLCLLLMAVYSRAAAEGPDVANQGSLTQIPIEQLVTMEVLSASKIARQISDAPSAVSIVTAEDIKAFGYHTVAEILESMRGLYITNDRAYSFLGGRGFGRPGDFTGRIMLLVDGNQVNNNIYDSAGLGYTGIIDPSLIERVEYVSGPGSTIYGNNAFFGIINIVTKRGHDINGLQVTGEIASYQSREAKVTYGRRLENGAELLLSGSGFTSPGQTLFFPDTVTQLPGSDGVAHGLDDQRSHRLFGKLEWENWFAEVAYVTRKKDVPTAPYWADFNTPYNYEDTTLEASLRHDRQWSDNLKMSLRAYYGKYEYRGLTTYGTPWTEQSDGQWAGLNAQFVGTWFENQRILFGAEYRDNFKQDLAIQYLGLSVLNAAYSDKTLSLYAQDEITLNPRWMANVGARYDVNEDSTGRVTENVSPRLALIYKPMNSTSLKLSWSTAFRRGNPFEKYYTDGAPLTASQLTNPTLKPERMEAAELVVEHHFDKDTRLLGSIYHYQTEDYIRNETVPSGQKQFRNVKGGSTDGVELEFEKHWVNDVRLRTSAAYQHAEDGAGRWPVNSPRVIGKVNLSVPLYSIWHAGFEMQAYGTRRTEDNTTTGGYSLANLTVSADHVLPNLGVAIGIHNLFDRDYVNVAPSSNHYQTTIPQDGRSYWLRMTYDFK